MKRWKKLFAVLLLAVLAFGLCACSAGSKDESKADTTAPQETVSATVTAPETKTLTDGVKTVIYPAELADSDSTYPVIAWANGTSCATESYTSLLEELAKGGYIVVADADTMTADGTSQRDSIDYIINLNSDAESAFYNKVDTASIGVCGHSQGGRSSVNAAQQDSRIGCLVSIAGASSAEEASGLTTPSLFLTGTNDMVVVSSQWCKPSYDAVAGRAAYASLEDGMHTSCMTAPKKIANYTVAWFDAYLKNDAEAQAVFADDGKLANDGYWKDFENKN